MTIKTAPAAAAVRAWARENGLAVGERGRLSPDLVDAYEAAHRPAPARQEHQPKPGIGRTVKAKARWDWQRTG